MTKVVSVCGCCKNKKEEVDFYRDRKKINGLSTYCKECCKIKAKGRYSRNPDRCKEAMKQWRMKNPERNAFIKAKSSMGITEEQFYSIPKVCVICGSRENIVIDHSHQTGRIRGRLCSSCNKGIGFLRDCPTLLLRASDYILGIAKPDIFEATYEKVGE